MMEITSDFVTGAFDVVDDAMLNIRLLLMVKAVSGQLDAEIVLKVIVGKVEIKMEGRLWCRFSISGFG
jgi:hypothetical protein